MGRPPREVEAPPSPGESGPRIQAWGALAAADGPAEPIRFVAGAAAAWLGAAPEALLGTPLEGWFDAPSRRRLAACAAELDCGEPPAALELAPAAKARSTGGVHWLHRNRQGRLVLEWEPAADAEDASWPPEEQARRWAATFRRRGPAESAGAFVRGLREAIGFGAASLVLFHADGPRVVAEAAPTSDAASLRIGAAPADWLPALGTEGREAVWSGLGGPGAAVLPPPDGGAAALDLGDAVLRSPPDDAADALMKMGAASAVVAPLSDENGVWGAFVLLDAAGRRPSPAWRRALRNLASQRLPRPCLPPPAAGEDDPAGRPLRGPDEARRVVDAMLDAMLDAVVAVDARGTMRLVNRAAERLFGYSAAEMVGRNVRMLMPPPFCDEHDARIADYLRTGVGRIIGVGREVLGLRKDGSTFPLDLSVTETSSHGVRGFLGLMRDVSERRRMQDALQAALDEARGASQAKSRFLANLSHELRTPMNAILGLTDLALAGSLAEEQRVDLQIVKDSGQALLRLLDDLLDFARLEGRTVALRREPFSLRNCLQRLCRTLAPNAFHKGLEWICDLSSTLPEEVVGDEGRFEQLIRNLLDNALKYTFQGSVELRARAERTSPDQVQFFCEVRDTGPGIAPADQERIFEVFTQLDSAVRRRASGAGLGLAICRESARVLGGRLELQSAVGEGSRFTAVLPFAAPPPATPTAALPLLPPPPSSLSGAPPTGLLATPSAATARVFQAAAARFGARLETAESLEAALERQRTLADARAAATFGFLDEALYAQAGPDQLRRFAAGFPAGAVAFVGRFGAPRRSGEIPLSDLRIERAALTPILDAEFHATLQALLKAAASPPRSAADRAAADGSAADRPLLVLLAEDTIANQRVIVHFLERRGHRVVTALDGREALDRLEEQPFDLVLMDVQMPVMDGLTAAREIRLREKQRGGPALPVVAVTAHAFPEERPFFLEAGMDDVLVKPVNFAQLDALLQRIRRGRLEGPSPP